MTTPALVIAQARGDLGMREDPLGSNLVPITREFGKIPGYPYGGYGYPWCAAATSVWCKRAGLKPDVDYPHTASTIVQRDWAKKHGRLYKTPQVGDLVLYSTDGSAGGVYHVELVEKVTSSYITTIGGNTSGSAGGGISGNGDGCYRKTITRSNPRIYGYVRPRYAGQRDTPPWDGKSYPGYLVQRGDRGPEVKVVQQMLTTFGWKISVDGDFGPQTEHAVRVFQKNHGLEVDGIVGPQTWAALAKGPVQSKTKTSEPAKVQVPNVILRRGSVGAAVKTAQRLLKTFGWRLEVDGIFGPRTEHAVKVFQKNRGLLVDGIIGPQTWAALARGK